MTHEKLLHERHVEQDGQLGLQPPLDVSPDSGADGLPSVLMIAGVHPMVAGVHLMVAGVHLMAFAVLMENISQMSCKDEDWEVSRQAKPKHKKSSLTSNLPRGGQGSISHEKPV